MKELEAAGKPVEVTRYGIPRGFHDVAKHPVAHTQAHLAVGAHGTGNTRNAHPVPTRTVHKTWDPAAAAASSRAPHGPSVGAWAPSAYGYHYQHATSGAAGHHRVRGGARGVRDVVLMATRVDSEQQRRLWIIDDDTRYRFGAHHRSNARASPPHRRPVPFFPQDLFKKK